MSYYTILDLPTDCTLEEIKKSYKQLAKIFHPDKNQSDGGAKFKSITEAYKLEMQTSTLNRTRFFHVDSLEVTSGNDFSISNRHYQIAKKGLNMTKG